MMPTCTVCQKEIDLGGEFYEVETRMGTIAMLCSPSCLVEFGWVLRSAQPKLSKSKMSDCIDCRMDPHQGFVIGVNISD